MDPLINCVLAVCCPPLSQNQYEALAKLLVRDGVDADAAETCAKVMLQHFDLAPQGSLQAFKDAIAALARGANYPGNKA
jgi:hypothetical protein